MKIYSKQGVELLDIQVDDSSVRYRSIMSDDSLTLKFSHTEPVTVPVGSYVNFEGQRYTLWLPENFKKHNTRNFEYTITLGGYREALKLFKFKDLSAVPYRPKFWLTAKPVDFLTLLVDNMNVHDSGWTVGGCIDAVERTLSFNHEYCLDVLNRLAQEWSTEFEFEGKKIHLRKVEKFKDVPLELSYGKGKGFKSGVGRMNDGDKQPIGRLYVQGGERNIDYSQYGSPSLLLPKSQTLIINDKTYRTDEHGMYITRDGNNLIAEDSYDAQHIYPKRVGTVSEVIVVDVEKNFYDIIDTTIPEALDFSEYRIDGEKATIIFQSGALAGREFDIEQTDKSLTGYIHAERRFKIVPQELDGIIMPSGAFVPVVGDKYAIFNISMPDSYISDNATQSGASWDMFRECVQYFSENEKQKFNFTGELDGIWSKSKWLEIGGKILPGGHVLFSDDQFLPNGEIIRITAIKDYVNFPHKPEITLSNAPVAGGLGAQIGELEGGEVVVEENYKKGKLYTKRRWRDLMETMGMLEDAILDFDSSISPISIRTMQLIVGDESLQFRFVSSKTAPVQVPHAVAFDVETKILTSDAGIIQHMTLGITEISPTHTIDSYLFWDMAAYTSPPLEAKQSYYLYAKCDKASQDGTFLLSEAAIELNDSATHYHFLMGIVNSEHGGERSIVTLYGFTEILPGQITTEVIASPDRKLVIDLLNSTIKGKISFINENDEYEDIEKVKLYLQYSEDGVNWHDVYTQLDVYMRQKNGASGEWSDAMPIGKGEDGVGIVSTVDFYGVSNHPSILPIYFYEGVIPSKTAVQYLWRYEKITYTDNTYSTTTPRVIVGKDARGISEIKNAFTYSSSNTTVVNSPGWQWTIAALGARPAGYFLWMRDDIFYTDGTSSSTVERLVVEGKDGDDAFADPDIIAKINQSAAITDKFGTDIDGGLIQTVMMLLREAGSMTNTAGVSGIQGPGKNHPAMWAGGTHAQALAVTTFLEKIKSGQTPTQNEYASLAKIALLHSGAGKYGDFIVNELGKISIVDPTTGFDRLVFTTENLPSVIDLKSGTSSSGSISIGSGSTSTVQALPGIANVTQPNGIGQMGGLSITVSASGKLDNFGRSSFVSAVLVLYKDNVRVRGIWSVDLFFLSSSYTNDSETRIFNPAAINLAGKGVYTFKLEVVRTGDVQSVIATSTAFPFSWNATLAGIKKQQYGLDGMMFFYSNHHFHFTEGNGLDIGGKTNMPGALLSGTVNINGGSMNMWGAKTSGTPPYKYANYYRVYHSVGHSEYSVQITAVTPQRIFSVINKQPTYFDVEARTLTGVLSTADFDFVIFGRNY